MSLRVFFKAFPGVFVARPGQSYLASSSTSSRTAMRRQVVDPGPWSRTRRGGVSSVQRTGRGARRWPGSGLRRASACLRLVPADQRAQTRTTESRSSSAVMLVSVWIAEPGTSGVPVTSAVALELRASDLRGLEHQPPMGQDQQRSSRRTYSACCRLPNGTTTAATALEPSSSGPARRHSGDGFRAGQRPLPEQEVTEEAAQGRGAIIGTQPPARRCRQDMSTTPLRSSRTPPQGGQAAWTDITSVNRNTSSCPPR